MKLALAYGASAALDRFPTMTPNLRRLDQLRRRSRSAWPLRSLTPRQVARFDADFSQNGTENRGNCSEAIGPSPRSRCNFRPHETSPELEPLKASKTPLLLSYLWMSNVLDQIRPCVERPYVDRHRSCVGAAVSNGRGYQISSTGPSHSCTYTSAAFLQKSGSP